MTLRSPRERAIQTLAYEAGGLCLSVPGYQHYSGTSSQDSAALMLSLSLAVLLWAPIHNTVFDRADLHLSGRAASDRPNRWRIVHAISLEVTVLVFTLPLMVLIGGLGWGEALMVDVGLTLLYVAYAYVFHIAYDRLRPVRPDREAIG